MPDVRLPTPPARKDYSRPDPPPPGTPGHDEALLDESINETFPASDPLATTQPGSTLNETAQESAEAARRDRKKSD